MSCSCKQFTVDLCLTTLRVGTIDATTTAGKIIAERVGDKRREVFSITSGVSGECDLTLNEFFTSSTTYKIWVTLDSNSDYENKETLTFADTTTDDCILVTFRQSYDSGDLESITTTIL